MLHCNQKTILCDVEETIYLFYDYQISVLFHPKKMRFFLVHRPCYFAAFLTNQKENVLRHLTEKIMVSMEKFMLPRKILNVIRFCKDQHNA